MIWKGTPYYTHIEYNDKKDPSDDLPVYSINKPRPESIAVPKILAGTMGEGIGGQTKPKVMKKSRLIEELEEIGLIDKNASVGAKQSKLKGL